MLSVETRIQSYLRSAASRIREVEWVGPFLATFTPHSSNPFLNYAIPEDDAQPSQQAVDALVTAFERRSLIPRLEYIPALAPRVEAALVACGFVPEGRLPLLVCPRGAAYPLPVPAGIEIIRPVSDADLRALLVAQHEAYGDPPPTPQAVARLRNSVAAGTIAVLARDNRTHEPAGGGVCSAPEGGVTELAGIGVRVPFRCRGIAGALTARLTQDAFAAGVTLPFLMAAHDAEARIYARAGFSPIGEILHISLPPDPPI
jgi:hypothetical protein